MEIAVGAQALGLVLAFVMGAGMGVLYDVLRPLRRRSGRGGAAALDALYPLVFESSDGRIRIYQVTESHG